MDQIHNPERIEGETMDQYAGRRRMSRRLAGRSKLIHAKVTAHTATQAKKLRRSLVKQIGIRQAKKALRAARAALVEYGGAA